MGDLDSIEKEIKYIRGKVDDIWKHLSDYDVRISVLEKQNEDEAAYRQRDNENHKVEIDRVRSQNERRVYWVAVLALAVSVITVITKVIGL